MDNLSVKVEKSSALVFEAETTNMFFEGRARVGAQQTQSRSRLTNAPKALDNSSGPNCM